MALEEGLPARDAASGLLTPPLSLGETRKAEGRKVGEQGSERKSRTSPLPPPPIEKDGSKPDVLRLLSSGPDSWTPQIHPEFPSSVALPLHSLRPLTPISLSLSLSLTHTHTHKHTGNQREPPRL